MGELIYIVGAGGNGRVCAEIAEAGAFVVAGFIDTPRQPDERINGKPIPYLSLRGLHAAGMHAGGAIFVATSGNAERLATLDEAWTLGFRTPALIHPSSVISPSATVAEATVIMPGVVVHTNARIGRGCILNTCCSVDHDSIVEDGVQIAPGVHAASTVTFGKCSFVGTGAAIKPCIRIGAGAIIGAGAVVIRDVEANTRVVGNPARAI